ncbi:MAG: GAF domain-containing protein [Ekhidna sp.]
MATPLLSLSKSKYLHEGNFKKFLGEVLQTICKESHSSRAGFWLFNSRDDEFENIVSYNNVSMKISGGVILDRFDFPEFFDFVQENLLVVINGSSKELERDGFILDYLAEHKLKSWLCFQVWNDGKLFGIVSLEWKENKKISEREELLLVTSASLISQAYDSLLRLKEEVVRKKELESYKGNRLDEEKEELVRKLSDHAFYTSHTIRHPLSTILALSDLIKLNWEDRENYEELLQQLKIETMNLDEAIRVMTAKIELD